MPSNHTDLKKFAQSARRSLREQVAARLDQVLKTDSAALREREAAKRELSQQIAETSKKAVIDRVAYTWFNRFCALRFMDVNRYNRIGVVSPAEGFTQPEILQEAKGGYIDEDLQKYVDCPAVFDLLTGRRPSANQQQEAYRLLLVAATNSLNSVMPFLFEPIADYTELLMPQDLLTEHSILHALREALTAEACQDVEVIGWLYQFYISERKDEVFEGLKNGKKIDAEDIPAATQLFTPHWIVRYLVENSLGRLWMLNRPTSQLVEKMDYYIKPEEPETDFLHVSSPEEIKVCDPACGSGHMLTYAFDLLYAIYEEEGYPSSNIPRLILEKNLYGIEIDERAGDLAAFALAMKARGRDRRFFGREVQPQICVLENITFTNQELKEYTAAMGQDLFTEPLLQTLKQFEQAKNFGSLIHPVMTDTTFIHAELERKGMGGSIFLYGVHRKVIKILTQSEFLDPRYHVVIANPPYMGDGGMNDGLKEFAQNSFPDSKSDTYAMFIERGFDLVVPNGYNTMVTMQSWMFLSSYEKLRIKILSEKTIISLLQIGYNSFPELNSKVVQVSAVTIHNSKNSDYVGTYINLNSAPQAADKKQVFLTKNQRYDYFVQQSSFKIIPGSPIAYWISNAYKALYDHSKLVSDIASVVCGMTTGDNERFVRMWHEVNHNLCGWNIKSLKEAVKSAKKWFPYQKGGNFRKWYGNNIYVVNWENDGHDILESGRAYPRARHLYFKDGISWSFVSSSNFGVRSTDSGYIFDMGGCSAFPINPEEKSLLIAFLCTKIILELLKGLNPTLNFQVGNVGALPWLENEIITNEGVIREISKRLVNITRSDWDSFETSWDFSFNPILQLKFQNYEINKSYFLLRESWKNNSAEAQSLENENNRIFIKAYNLSGDLESYVPLEEITLTCNPHYRYGGNRSEAELEALLLADTMREFISYAVGCMFGRYSLDKPGLILANQGETLQDYLRQVPNPTFLPDEDNAIPVLDGEWFSDDITERFKKFLRVTFGAEHYEENLAFIEQAIGRDIRSYFLKEFYSQHVKMYQKRPIYWMFSSPKGSFNVLIYMHRYQPDTISVILNRYLREFRGKLEARKGYLEQINISAGASAREKTAALKEMEGLNKTLEEIRVYERDIVYPLAVQGIQIDLDDGVKVNYNKFGKALAKITGLSE